MSSTPATETTQHPSKGTHGDQTVSASTDDSAFHSFDFEYLPHANELGPSGNNGSLYTFGSNDLVASQFSLAIPQHMQHPPLVYFNGSNGSNSLGSTLADWQHAQGQHMQYYHFPDGHVQSIPLLQHFPDPFAVSAPQTSNEAAQAVHAVPVDVATSSGNQHIHIDNEGPRPQYQTTSPSESSSSSSKHADSRDIGASGQFAFGTDVNRTTNFSFAAQQSLNDKNPFLQSHLDDTSQTDQREDVQIIESNRGQKSDDRPCFCDVDGCGKSFSNKAGVRKGHFVSAGQVNTYIEKILVDNGDEERTEDAAPPETSPINADFNMQRRTMPDERTGNLGEEQLAFEAVKQGHLSHSPDQSWTAIEEKLDTEYTGFDLTEDQAMFREFINESISADNIFDFTISTFAGMPRSAASTLLLPLRRNDTGGVNIDSGWHLSTAAGDPVPLRHIGLPKKTPCSAGLGDEISDSLKMQSRTNGQGGKPPHAHVREQQSTKAPLSVERSLSTPKHSPVTPHSPQKTSPLPTTETQEQESVLAASNTESQAEKPNPPNGRAVQGPQAGPQAGFQAGPGSYKQLRRPCFSLSDLASIPHQSQEHGTRDQAVLASQSSAQMCSVPETSDSDGKERVRFTRQDLEVAQAHRPAQFLKGPVAQFDGVEQFHEEAELHEVSYGNKRGTNIIHLLSTRPYALDRLPSFLYTSSHTHIVPPKDPPPIDIPELLEAPRKLASSQSTSSASGSPAAPSSSVEIDKDQQSLQESFSQLSIVEAAAAKAGDDPIRTEQPSEKISKDLADDRHHTGSPVEDARPIT
ncbi:hypothetical protein ABW21_db0205757 [Orbilia brochopaga]|nr:hypothetical protein ABW21_db0205757 [Drechslerella brochopaga]